MNQPTNKGGVLDPNAQLAAASAAIAIGRVIEGGFYAGAICIDGVAYGLVTAPKASGELKAQRWSKGYANVDGAQSLCDGRANTAGMVAAGSKLADQALALDIGGFKDWYIPSLDESDLQYRAFKPTTQTNSRWARSGINLNSIPPAHPYTPDFPAQTALEIFRVGGSEAFEPDWYWTSSQHAAGSGRAWMQWFGGGNQSGYGKGSDFRVRVVRRFKL